MELLRRFTILMLSLENIKQYLLTNNIDQVVTKMNRYVCVALFSPLSILDDSYPSKGQKYQTL